MNVYNDTGSVTVSSGACSGGVCIDNNLCDERGLHLAEDCVQDGTCDPATASALPGDHSPSTRTAPNGWRHRL